MYIYIYSTAQRTAQVKTESLAQVDPFDASREEHRQKLAQAVERLRRDVVASRCLGEIDTFFFGGVLLG